MNPSAVASPDAREQQVRAGDRAALADLLMSHEAPLRRWIEQRLDRRLRGRVSTSDVVQEVYLAADRRIEHYGTLTDMPFGVWVRLLAQQRLIDLYRKHLAAGARAADRERSLDAGSGSEPLAARLAGSITSPSRAAIRHEDAERLGRALESLEPADREILELRHSRALGNDAVAARLGLTKSAATKRYIRALTRLKARLEATPSGSEVPHA